MEQQPTKQLNCCSFTRTFLYPTDYILEHECVLKHGTTPLQTIEFNDPKTLLGENNSVLD